MELKFVNIEISLWIIFSFWVIVYVCICVFKLFSASADFCMVLVMYFCWQFLVDFGIRNSPFRFWREQCWCITGTDRRRDKSWKKQYKIGGMSTSTVTYHSDTGDISAESNWPIRICWIGSRDKGFVLDQGRFWNS